MDSKIAGIDQTSDPHKGDVILQHFDEFQLEMAMAFQCWDEKIQGIWSDKE